ncbi:MAG: ABC transporter substrate-binding protein, partial [Gammaproteobacteria bacterium]|nr:ABC transporter substrate-binding protein [Gammaproteobacteria bacterium]
MKKIIAIKNGFKKKICVALTVLTFVGGLPLVGYSQNLFRWAAQNDILTLDPHSQNHATTNNILNHAYEGLVQYDKNLKVEPALATSWTVISPTVWRFNLRPNVKFHDGAALTADDVLFSFDRIRQPSSTHVIYVAGIKEIKKINDLTIDLVLDGPNPTLLNTLVGFMIMNKSWSEKNNSSKVQDYKAKEETFASRNENGTGPFIIKEWVPSQKVVMTKNKNWWGTPAGNVTDVVYTPISSDPTRVAALIAGDVDAVTDLPTQDVGRLKSNSNIKVLDGSEVRTIFIQMDLGSDSLKYGSPGKNPFKDVRVRQAMSKTVDRVAIQRTIMRGLSVPGVLMVAPGVNGFNEEANKPFTVDIEGAKKLLQEAGYPNGFEFT